MARPRNSQPTAAELEVLKILWSHEALSVRELKDALAAQHKPRAYTSVMSLLQVMYEKGLVDRRAVGRAYLYRARRPREKTLRNLVGDLYQRAFEGSASTLVAHLLEHSQPDEDELREIRALIEHYEERHRDV